MNQLYDNFGARKYLTTTERNRFLEAARKEDDQHYTFCATLAHSGARISEILALTPARLDLDAGFVIVESLKKRRKGVFRTVPLPDSLLTDLEVVHKLSTRQLDPCEAKSRLWSWSRTTAWKRVKTTMTLAGITGVRATPKGLRHAFAVTAIQAELPLNLIKKWLGHSRLSTTAIYADAMGAEERSIAARMWNA